MALCAAATLAVVLGACSSSASSSSGAGASTAATGSTPAKGSPIEFVVISGTGPGTPGADQYLVPGAQAAVDEINAAGGVKGHPLQLNFCNTQGNVNQAGTCAASAVANSSVIASIGNYNYLGGTEIYPIFEKAGLPAIAVHGVGPPEYSSPVIFPTDVGAIGNDTGAVALLAHEGIHSAALIAFTPSSYQTYVQAINTYTIPALAKAGMQFKLDPPVLFPGTATSLSSYAAQTIALKPPAVILSLGPTQAITFLQALRQQGYTGIVVCSAGVTPASQIKQVLGASAGNIQAVGYYSHNSSGWQQLEADMAKYQPQAPVSETDVDPWLGVKIFANVVEQINGPITRAAVLAGLSKISGYSTSGLTPPLSFTTPNPLPGLSREFNPTVVNLNYSNGVYTDRAPTTFINVFTGAKLPIG